jgi:hypothetical protein
VPVPPPPRKRRARRKETIDALLEAWESAGLDPFEADYLTHLGYGRWVARGRTTAEMLVELLLLTMDAYDDDAADPVADRATERWRMIEILQWRRVQGHSEAEQSLLDELTSLDRRAADRRAPAMKARSDDRLRTYEREDDQTLSEWDEIRERYPGLVRDLLRQVTESVYSKETIRLDGARARVVELGEQARLRSAADELRKELGERFLAPSATMEYRAARVRKWIELRRKREAALGPPS